VADRWRERIRDRVLSVLTPPAEADSATRAGRAMVAALLFGELSGFAATDLDLIRQASLAHTLALSGMNVSYVVAVAIALVWIAGRWHPAIFLRTPRPYLILLVAAPLVAGYCWLGGYSPSLYRAVLMFAGCGLLLFLGRHAPLCDSLFLALAAMLAVSPLTAYDVRLQLSAAAVAGIGLLWPPFGAFCSRLPRSRLFRWIVVPVLAGLWTSLCAEAAVLPIIVRLFGDWNCNPWINAAWLPLLGFVVTPMALIGLALLPVPLLSAAGAWLLLAAAWCCQELMHGLAWLESHGLLLSTAVLRPAWPELLGCYGLLASLALVLAGRPKPLAALLTSLALLVGPGLWRDLADSREAVSLTVFDVGQGQSVAVTLPGGKRLLVDGGGLLGNFDVGRAVVGAALADNHPPRLEAVFASHPHSDHVKGLISLLQRFSVASYDDNGGLPEGALAAPIQAALAERRIPRTSLAAGDRLNLGHDLALDVLHPGPDDDPSGNNGSLVLRLTWHGRGLAVLPGDIERSVAHRLTCTGTPLQAAVLVLPHHGSSSSLSRLFHAAVAPRVAIASAGDSGRYPSGKVVESLARLGCPTYATNRHGAVTVRFDSPTAAPVVETMGGTDASAAKGRSPLETHHRKQLFFPGFSQRAVIQNENAPSASSDAKRRCRTIFRGPEKNVSRRVVQEGAPPSWTPEASLPHPPSVVLPALSRLKIEVQFLLQGGQIAAGAFLGHGIALGQDIPDQVRVLVECLAPGPDRFQEGGHGFHEQLLAVPAAPGGLAAALADLRQPGRIGQQLVIGIEVALLGIARVLAARPLGAGEHAHDLFLHGPRFLGQADGIAVALAHLAAVQARQLGIRRKQGLGLGEEVAVEVVGPAGDLPGELHVGQLILAHGHESGLVQQDVRSHEHRVAQEAIGGQILGRQFGQLVLVGWVALQPRHRRDHGQEQMELHMLLDLGLLEQHAFFRIEPGRHPVLDQLRHKPLDALGLGVFRGQGVPVGHEEKAVVGLLQFDPVFEHAEVMAQMQGAGGAHAGNDPFCFPWECSRSFQRSPFAVMPWRTAEVSA
jgi:competence protein ComEC